MFESDKTQREFFFVFIMLLGSIGTSHGSQWSNMSNCVWLQRRCQCQHRCRCRERRLPRRRTRRGPATIASSEWLWVSKGLWVKVVQSYHPKKISKNLQQSSTTQNCTSQTHLWFHVISPRCYLHCSSGIWTPWCSSNPTRQGSRTAACRACDGTQGISQVMGVLQIIQQ